MRRCMEPFDLILKYFGYSYTDIAKILGVSPQAVRDWAKTTKKIPKQRLVELSQLFGIPEEYLTRRTLNKVEEYDIQIAAIKHQSEKESEEIEETIDGGDGNEYLIKRNIVPYLDEIRFLKEQRQIQLLLLETESFLKDPEVGQNGRKKADNNYYLLLKFNRVLREGNEKKNEAVVTLLDLLYDSTISHFDTDLHEGFRSELIKNNII
jgi:transcriptional regulator with XRE-family HTH domain